MACWARLYDAENAMAHFDYYIHHYCLNSLFAICAKAMQVDGSFGISAAIAEMLIQSHEGELDLLPTLPPAWADGSVSGLCARGGFEIDLKWSVGTLNSVAIHSKRGNRVKIRYKDRTTSLETDSGKTYRLSGKLNTVSVTGD
jgi:alpha-L-fucosidase 2